MSKETQSSQRYALVDTTGRVYNVVAYDPQYHLKQNPIRVKNPEYDETDVDKNGVPKKPRIIEMQPTPYTPPPGLRLEPIADHINIGMHYKAEKPVPKPAS
jgi:hypothetical protein